MKKIAQMIAVMIFLFYFVSPVDPVPDVVPVLGQMDDISIGLVLALASGMLGKEKESEMD